MPQISMTLLFLLLVAAMPVCVADEKDFAMENSWESEMRIVDEDTIRISTRKREAGDLEEINKPGTSIYNAFQSVQQATLLRAALECKHLGYEYFKVTGTRNITTQRDRNRVGGEARESDFTMAPGHYQTEIDVGIQVTADLFAGQVPDPIPADTYSADQILIAFGLAEVVIDESTAKDE